MNHFATFEVFGTLVSKEALRQYQSNNQQSNGPPPHSIDFLLEKKTVTNGKENIQVISVQTNGYNATGIDRTDIGTELFVKGNISGSKGTKGDRYFINLNANEIAKIQPKPPKQQWNSQSNNGGGYQNNGNQNRQQGYQQQQGNQGNSQGYQNNNNGYQNSQPPAQQQYDGGDEAF
jgi:hypothetical protein